MIAIKEKQYTIIIYISIKQDNCMHDFFVKSDIIQ